MDRKKVFVLVGCFFGLILISIFIFFFMRSGQNQQGVPTSLPTGQVQPTPNPTSTLVPTPKPLPNVWLVSFIDVAKIHQNGFTYDMVTFRNRDDANVVLYGQCAEPGWPSPPLLTEYALNEWGVLYPIVDNADHNLQRFIWLK